jgi:hypothetical protein
MPFGGTSVVQALESLALKRGSYRESIEHQPTTSIEELAS